MYHLIYTLKSHMVPLWYLYAVKLDHLFFYDAIKELFLNMPSCCFIILYQYK